MAIRISVIKPNGQEHRPWPPRSVRFPIHPRRWRDDIEITKARYGKEEICPKASR